MHELDLALAGHAAPPPARLLRLWHGGLPWAVANESVVEVVGTERLQRNPRAMPGSPCGWLLGDHEGIAVFLPPEIGLETRTCGAVVVLQPSAGPRCGLGVDAVQEVRAEPIARLRLLPVLAACCRWAFPRVVLWGDGLALEIAPEAVPRLAAAARGEAAQPVRTAALPAGEPRFDAPLPKASSSSGLLVFTLPGCGGQSFALPAAQVVEVLSASAPRPVPGAPEPLLGLCAWRGEALPLLDLGRAVGLPSNLARGEGFSHGLIARTARSRQLLVLPVERIAGVRQGPFPQLATAAPPFPGARRVLGAFASGEEVLVVPDLDGALRTSPVEPHAAVALFGGR
jgi:chemotaxis signal transduction protein